VHAQIGCSGYRIDLAVVDPTAPGRYLLGIECDGATYHSAATARDRDRLRAAVLRGLGWTLVRVWSTDFWQDPAGELQKLEQAISAAKSALAAAPVRLQAAAAPSAAAAATGAAIPSVVATSDPVSNVEADGPRPYDALVLVGSGNADQFAEAKALRTLRSQLAEVLAAEGPMVFDRLARTVAAAWDVARVTDRIRERVRAALPAAAIVDGETAWADAAQRESFRGFRVPGDDGAEANWRSAEELPLPEIGNAMVWLLRQHQALVADDLAREAARCFGITRLGAVVKDVMSTAIADLAAAGTLVRGGDVLRLA
jgi:hypothetical protein